MPYEPLRTDEPLRGPVARDRDFETQLMGGCATIVTGSLISYALFVWPWFFFPEYRLGGLLTILGFGSGTACLFGFIAARRYGLAGSVGFVGGSMAAAAFSYLRLQQTILARLDPKLPDPEYPDWVAWAMPLAWLTLSVLLALVSYRKEGTKESRERPDNA